MRIICCFFICCLTHNLCFSDEGYNSIFNGKTLEGWKCRPLSQSANWTVEDGLIIGRGKGQESYLMFNDQLGDFELKFSYKFISDEGNTGVEVRSHPVKGKASRLHGYHADIGHVGIGDKANIPKGYLNLISENNNCINIIPEIVRVVPKSGSNKTKIEHNAGRVKVFLKL